MWILAAVDIAAFKKCPEISRSTLLVRIVSLVLLGVILTAAAVMALIFL